MEIRESTVDEAAEALRRGQAVVFPTDTVYGLGVAVEAARSPQVLFDIKRRDRGKPVAWLVGDASDLERYGREVPDVACVLARAHWPGPLTLVVKASQAVPPAFRSAEGTIGLRMPDSETALALVRAAGGPVATTSANLSGGPAPRTFEELDPALVAAAAAAVRDDARKSGVASTVVDCTGEGPVVLRRGAHPGRRPGPVLRGFRERPRLAVSAIMEREQSAGEGAHMDQPVTRTSVGFKSHDGKTQIKGLIWCPERVKAGGCATSPVGIVQIVHGMSEHVGRYDDFARFLAAQGYVVCAHDHVGHGKSVSDPKEWGCLPVEGGKDILIDDVHELRKTVAARYARQTPYFLFGHSMGSFVTRAYLARHAEGLAGAVLCGTGNQSRALSKAGNLLARRIAASKGEDTRSDRLDGMGAGAFSKQIENPRTPFDWLSTDPAVVDAYIEDEMCGAMFSVGGYATLTDLTGEVVSPSCAAKVPKGLPVLFVSGAEDPVGACGKGVQAAADLLRHAGVSDVEVKLYEGMRHEILNEPEHAQVYGDVLDWIRKHQG